jgi:PII-like signaling protein
MSLPTHVEVVDTKQQEIDELREIIKKLIVNITTKDTK